MTILERFKKYIAFDTVSDENSDTYPSTPSQIEFGKMLVQDLKELGVEEAYQDDNHVVYAFIDNKKDKTIGLISHMDTAPTIEGGIKHPRLIEKYDGKDIVLNSTYTMKVEDFPVLKTVVGDDLLVTDGEHLLGGDDKAGIAIVFEFLTYYLKHKNEFNYNLAISFTADEEIGRGASKFDVKKMKADIAYTLDGESIYEANFENFNAASAKVTIEGVGVHPGNAKNIMINAVLLGIEFNNLLPKDMIPSKTEDHEGFIHLDEFNGDVEKTTLSYILRDHDKVLLEDKKEMLKDARNKILIRYPKAKIDLEIHDEYRNMRDYFMNHMEAIELINKAYINSHLPISYTPIRGGTDGATITYMGLPCPNLGTGDFNPHGRFEFVSVTQMKKMVEILKELFK